MKPEVDSAVVFEVSKKAVPVGTLPVLQLAPLPKSPLPGAFSQVASCANAGWTAASARAVDAKSARRSFGCSPDIAHNSFARVAAVGVRKLALECAGSRPAVHPLHFG